jgi:hypothetical protein
MINYFQIGVHNFIRTKTRASVYKAYSVHKIKYLTLKNIY